MEALLDDFGFLLFFLSFFYFAFQFISRLLVSFSQINEFQMMIHFTHMTHMSVDACYSFACLFEISVSHRFLCIHETGFWSCELNRFWIEARSNPEEAGKLFCREFHYVASKLHLSTAWKNNSRSTLSLSTTSTSLRTKPLQLRTLSLQELWWCSGWQNEENFSDNIDIVCSKPAYENFAVIIHVFLVSSISMNELSVYDVRIFMFNRPEKPS